MWALKKRWSRNWWGLNSDERECVVWLIDALKIEWLDVDSEHMLHDLDAEEDLGKKFTLEGEDYYNILKTLDDVVDAVGKDDKTVIARFDARVSKIKELIGSRTPFKDIFNAYGHLMREVDAVLGLVKDSAYE
ncbi:MAG: hypothetical protein MJZ20_06915 [Bacteroidaceae bacterium]|nr:hypothetical protein [Bacteroidaceae bacterium]